jgi:hypothetical protein
MIPYAIISISKKRLENIENIKKSFGYESENVKCFDISNVEDIKYFEKKYPSFQLSNFLIDKKYPTTPHRFFGETGCWMSHYNVWNYALENNFNDIIVIEDDCNVNENNLKNFLMKIEEEKQDVLMGGEWGEIYYLNRHALEYLVENAYEKGFKLVPVDEYIFDSMRDNYLQGRFGLKLFSQLFTSEINNRMRAY